MSGVARQRQDDGGTVGLWTGSPLGLCVPERNCRPVFTVRFWWYAGNQQSLVAWVPLASPLFGIPQPSTGRAGGTLGQTGQRNRAEPRQNRGLLDPPYALSWKIRASEHRQTRITRP